MNILKNFILLNILCLTIYANSQFIGHYICTMDPKEMQENLKNAKYINMDNFIDKFPIELTINDNYTGLFKFGNKEFNMNWEDGDETFITTIGKENKTNKLYIEDEQYIFGETKKWFCNKQ